MTTQSAKAWSAVEAAVPAVDDSKDALDGISRMLVGTKMLADEPGVVYSLAAQQAHPADAGAIDQFMQGLDASKMVNIARAAGTKIALSSDQVESLKQLNEPFEDVQYTVQDAASAVKAQIEKVSKGTMTAAVNADGTLQLDANGDPVEKKVPTIKHSSGGGGFMGFLGDVGDHLKSAGGDVLSGLGKGYNYVNASLADGYKGFVGGFGSHAGPSSDPTVAAAVASARVGTQDQDMKAQGYDPSSYWSTVAFRASGHAHQDLSALNNNYGTDKVNTALEYLKDPTKYREGIEQDPTSYAQTADGQTVLTADAASKIKYLSSKDFSTLARKVNAQDATIGNALANSLGLDPINHPTDYAILAGATNIAASFAVDPTMQALGAVKVAKTAMIGIDSLGDADKAASILTRSSKLPYVASVQRGWQAGIDYGTAMRATNDAAEQAALTAAFTAKVPSLAPLASEFIGNHAVTGMAESIENGRKVAAPTYGVTGGIKSLDDAADFVQSKFGMNLLMNGRAATQSSLMPGALSAVGFKQIKGLTAGWMTARSAARAEGAAATVVTRATADPALAEKLITDGMLRRLPPEADNAVAFDGSVLAEKSPVVTESTLPSASRALAVTDVGRGQIAYNLRATGDPLADASIVGRFSPTAVAARSRLAAQRLSTLLPRNTEIDVADPRAADTVYKYAMTYLNRGDANILRSAWVTGDAGQRKAIASGLMDQVGHAAGLGKSTTGQAILDRVKTEQQAYSAAGSEIELDGQNVGLFEGQTRAKWQLPSFREINNASSKIGLWESTFGRPLTAATSDVMMGQWKMGALFKPSSATRNMLEGGLRTALEGSAGDAVRARAVLTTPNKELWATLDHDADKLDEYTSLEGATDPESLRRRNILESSPRVQHHNALVAGDTDLAKQIANGSRLSGDLLGRSTPLQKITEAGPLALVGRTYRKMLGRDMDPEDVKALLSLGDDDLGEMMEGYRQQVLEGDLGFKHAANEATAVAKQGYGPATLRASVHRSLSRGLKTTEDVGPKTWSHHQLDGELGVQRYANALGQRVNAMPQTARAAIAMLKAEPDSSLDNVVAAMESERKNTAFGKVFFDDPTGNPNLARNAVTPEEVISGKRDWAQKVVDEYGYLLSKQSDGSLNDALADHIAEKGMAPDGDWIADNIPLQDRPESALAPDAVGTMAMPNGGIKSIPATLQDFEGGAYQWMVERPLQRLMSSPVMAANYTLARKGLNRQVEQMVEAGISREGAENLAKELSIRQSWVKTEQLIDDPGQKSQFDVIARNMFPFSRATQAMLRRWGTGLWRNPVAARKLMLSYEGAVHSGMIYTNSYGEPTFTYPGSGAMNQVMRAVSVIPGFENVAAFPTSTNMTGGVLMSVPGADNPLRMGMGPMISIPLREVYKHLLPTAYRGDAESLDSFINGPVGTGETFSQLVPTAVRKFYQAASTDDKNSALASTMNGAFANLAAAGLIPPTDASPSELQEFRGRLQTQVRSQLFLRAVFSLFSPASPSTPDEGTSGSRADYGFSIEGIRGLSQEYQKVLNETGGDVGRATAVFTAMHPDQVVYKTDGERETKLPASAYETSRSQANAKGAYLPATAASLKWLETNGKFVEKYKGVAAYFLPAGASTEPFSDAAYQSQLEFGLRQRKTPQEFMNDVYVKHAESSYYPAVQQYDRLINNAKATGNTDYASQLTASKSQWESTYKNLNPLLGAKLEDFGTARATALGQLADLRSMVKSNAAPDGLTPKLATLIKVYDDYEASVRSHPGGTDVATQARSQALDTFNRWAETALAGTPLTSVFNGVFRTINSNFEKIDTGS